MELRGLIQRRKLVITVAILAVFGALAACGTQDYQKPVQQFQNASAVVASAARDMLAHVNVVEQNGFIDQAVFERKPIDLPQIRQYELISADEISVRTKALDQLQAYASNLASLAQGKDVSAISDQTNSLSKSLSALSKEASNLPVSKASFLKNAQFGSALQVAAQGIGLVAQAIAQHKARTELQKAIVDNQKPIDDLINLLGEELEAAYERQKATLSAQQVYFSKAYEHERAENHPDPNALLSLGDRLKSYIQQRSALEAADPAPSLKSMQGAHDALVKYAQSNHDPQSLHDLLNAAQAFVNEVQPFGQALQTFLNSK